jgi:hypothetical protein
LAERIIETSFTLSVGDEAGADIVVPVNGVTRPLVTDRFGAPTTWRCVAIWYNVVDGIPELTKFRAIDFERTGGNGINLMLAGGSTVSGQLRLRTFALYEFAQYPTAH